MKQAHKRQRMMLSHVPAELRQRCKAAAALSGKSLNDWVVEALIEKLEDEIDIREGLAALGEPTVPWEQVKAEWQARHRTGAVPD